MRKRSRPIPSRRSNSTSWLTLDVALKGLLLVGAVFLIYASSLHGTWIGDDSWYIAYNPLMHDPDRLWKAWFAPGSWVEFYPIEETVQWVQWQLWHDDTLGYHLTNVLLHLTSSFLVWYLLSKFGLRLAWLGALLFAIHPEVVDSVGEIVELKNTLSLPPYLLAMCLYIDYENTKSGRCYLWSLASFLVAMLCKITAAPFPLVILLYVWWKRGRIGWSDVKSSLPFFAVSLALGMTTVWSGEIYAAQLHQTSHGISPLGGFFFRLALAGQIISFYFSRCFLPINPVPIYPKWTVDPSHLLQFTPWPVFGLAVGWLWTKRRTWGRHALFGLGFFLAGLTPFLGFNTISYMQATWTLDHMLYIPIIGLIGLVVAGLAGIDAQTPTAIRPWSRGGLAVIFALLIFQSYSYAGQFLGEETLAAYNLRFNPGDGGLHNNYGAALAKRQDFTDAFDQFRVALQIDPHFANAEANLGNVYNDTGQIPEAMAAYQRALVDEPNFGPVHLKLADLDVKIGRYPEAIDHYQQVIRLDHDTPLVQLKLGMALCVVGKVDEGIRHFRQVIALQPNSPIAEYSLANALCQTGHFAEGIEHYRRVIDLQPDYADAHNNLGSALFQQGNAPEAQAEFERALALNPNFVDARNNLQQVEKLQSANPAPPK
jgi:tetratricopeptide (TPR) repeat protein